MTQSLVFRYLKCINYYLIASHLFTNQKCVITYCVFVITGETGIGKSTLMDTLFDTHFESQPSTHDLPGVKVKASTFGM